MASSDLPPDLRAVIRQKKLVFTVSTGRSGTRYLSFLLSRLPNTESVHEPEPSFASVMRTVQNDPERASAFWLEEKLPAIAEGDDPIYVETSHLFCKGFFKPLLELGVRPSLIFLRRNHRDVALSLYRLQTIPGRTEKALRFYLSPEDPGVHAPNDWELLHDYQLCYWYALEIERRGRLYRKAACKHGLSTAVLRFTSLLDNDIGECSRGLGLPELPQTEKWKVRLLKKVQTKRNKKSSKKMDVFPDNIDVLESEIEGYFAATL